MHTEQWLKAIDIWQFLVNKQPSHCQFFKNLSLSATKVMKYDLAIRAFEKVVQLEHTSNNLVKLSDLYLIAHDSTKARENISTAIAMGDQSIGRFETECKICRFENDRDGVLVAARKALKIKPNSDFAWLAIQEFGDINDNTECIKALAQLTSDQSNGSFELQQNLFTYAKALEKTNNYSLAFKQLTKAKSLQYKRFSDNGNHYIHEKIEQQYQRLASIDYPVITKSEKVEHIFIVGMPRSGTTLINRLLSQPAENTSCNESNGIATCFENLLLESSKTKDELSYYLAEHRAELYQSYCNYVDLEASILIDKMPHNFRYVGAILSTIPNARVIQMRRNPQDLALSIYSHQFHEYHNYACQLDHIAHAIAQANQLMDFWQKCFPEQVIDLNYQEFVQDPIKQGNDLFDFCNFDWDDNYLAFYKQNVPSFTFSEIQVRKPINTSKIGYSHHYDKELTEFRQAYNRYYESGK